MQYTRLGGTGLIVSRLCLGTMTFGLQSDEITSRAILDTALDAGVTFIDTADVYPLGRDVASRLEGRTEEVIGRWMKRRRNQLILATKAVGRMGPMQWNQGASRKHLLDAIDASLRRLDTDHVDLYQLHSDDPHTPLDETLEALDTIVKSGRARYVGVSNFLAYRIARALGRSEALHLAKFVCIQPRYNLLFREIERDVLPLAHEEKLGVIAYNPIAGGLLSGKHKFDAGPMEGTRFALGTAADRYKDRYWHKSEFETVEALKKLIEPTGLSLPTAAVAWVLANPFITSAIIGASRPDQLVDTLAAVNLKLDNTLKKDMDALTRQYRHGDAMR